MPCPECLVRPYLESSAQTEDTVVGFLWSETLQGSLHDIVLLGEQVIGPASWIPSAHRFAARCSLHSIRMSCSIRRMRIGGSVPQTELPVAGGVAVPVGQRLHPLLQPRPLHDVGGERRGRHGCGCSTADPSSRRRVLSSIAVLTVGGGEVVMRKKRKPIGRRAALGPQKAFALISAWSPPTKATSLVLHASSDV